jgi:mevalonate pyrophosphate decarboxylase
MASAAGLAAVAEALKEPAPSQPAFTTDDAVALLRKASQSTPKSTEVQIGGDHYKTMAIQPLTYIQANELDFEEGNIVKYISRWRKKGGIQDLEKAHDMLGKKIEFEKAKAKTGLMEYLSGLFKSV